MNALRLLLMVILACVKGLALGIFGGSLIDYVEQRYGLYGLHNLCIVFWCLLVASWVIPWKSVKEVLTGSLR